MRRWLLLLALVAVPALAQQRESLVSSRLTVAGEVKRELMLTVDELRAKGRSRGAVERGGYAGPRLVDLLDEADMRRDARHALRRTYVVATATDGHVAVFSWGVYSTAVGQGVLIAYERDGQPLRDGEGGIRAGVPGGLSPGRAPRKMAHEDRRPARSGVTWPGIPA